MTDTSTLTKSAEIYVKENCGNCDKTKALFNELGVEYTTVNITGNPEAVKVLKAKGFRAAPVVFVDGDSWSGFDEAKIRAHFG